MKRESTNYHFRSSEPFSYYESGFISASRLGSGMLFNTLHYFCTDDSEQEYALPFVLL